MGDMTAADRQLIARRLLAAIAIGLIVFAIIWFFFIRETQPPVPVSTTGQGQQDTSSTAGSTGTTTPTPTPVNPSSGQNPPNTPLANNLAAGQGQPNPDQLVAAGPGNAIALFGSAVIIATGLHHAYIHRPRRSNN